MNQTQFQSFWVQLKAPLRNQWENFTNEDLVQIQGDLATFNSKVEARYSEKTDEVKKWANRRYAHWTGWYEGYEDRKPIAGI